ncbi:MAG: tRNA 4-thiouridine(8) synthase ThiI [Ruminococcaceae bacterium]|nr:tRNA 4-thiouridine(8) synthase ThiI [Oscillospiraceae bacterium]
MNQKEILLCKYGEIVLKGANRKYFEDMLCREVKKRAAEYGSFDVYRAQSTIYVEPKDEFCDLDGMFASARKVFGIVTVARAAVCEKNMEAIAALAKEYVPQFLDGKRTFKVEAKRSDKAFALDSMQIAKEIGGVILSACPRMKVDVHNPDVVVRVEIREFGAYISAGAFKGAGGMPVGTNGRGLLLLSGGIDSPVAGYMMAKRGVKIEALHFESFPYTSERAREKVLELASILAEYAGEVRVHIVSLTHIQEELVKACDEDYFTLLLRRYMMTLAERVAKYKGCHALITGESIGQVASQTMQALCVTDCAVSIPVFRPCIGMDKEEIITVSRLMGAFETSIQPYEDCCTVFTPKHPKTKPELEKVLEQERKLDFDALCDEAFGTLYTVNIEAKY